MPKVGGRRKKARSHKQVTSELEKQLPRVFVVGKGDTSSQLQETVHDLRRCLYPNTAMKLDDRNKMPLRTFVKAAKVYNVTHILMLQKNNQRQYLRVLKVGGGEMQFRIVNFCRMRDVLHQGGQPFSFSFKDPLVVLNNFGQNTQTKMMGRALQELFPPINPQKLKPQKLKRVICFTYQAKRKVIYFRHYKVIVNQNHKDNSLASLIAQPNIDLSKFASIGQYLSSLHTQQEGSREDNQSRVKLVEIGPRFKLKFLSYKESTGQDMSDDKQVQLENTEMGGAEQ